MTQADPDGAAAIPADVGRWIDVQAERRPDDLAWADDARRATWSEAAERVARLAGWLSAHDVVPGERVALWLTNRTAVLEAVFACARLGAIAIPINARLTPPEVAYQLSDSTPRVLLVERGWRARCDQAVAAAEGAAPRRLEVDEAYERAIGEASPVPPRAHADPEDPMILMYTSGTTGRPKGALLPHRKTRFNSLNARNAFAITADDRVLVVAPLFHSLGLQILALPAIACGASVVVQEGFDPVRVWQTIAREGITYLGGVPTAHQRLLDALEGAPPPCLRFLFTAGAAAPTELIRSYHRRGIAMIQGYGQTETSMLTCLDADRALVKAGSVGHPLPYGELRLVEAATADGPVEGWRDVGPGVVGEIVVRGPIAMLGYWRKPEATRETLREGWVRTGDLAVRDADFDLTLVGRAREMYISGGENVYPAEVEAVLESHPDVAEAAVVAVADATWGEVGRAHLVPKPGAELDVAALGTWLAERLARYKQPRSFVIERALPRTASGKVQKHRLGEQGEEPSR
ncbi:MAG: AMP-binding protein [Myxococcota bacterium]